MSHSRESDVGYKRPPVDSQWKKGQSGNPRGGRKNLTLRALKIIDAKLAKPLTVTEAGRRRKATVLEIILRQLWAKEIAGDRSAAAVLLRYCELVPIPTDRPEIIIDDGEDERS